MLYYPYNMIFHMFNSKGSQISLCCEAVCYKKTININDFWIGSFPLIVKATNMERLFME